MGIFDNTPRGAVQRAHLNDAFGALRSDGGGPRQAPAAMQALQQHQARQRAAAALEKVQQGGGLPLGFNSPAFQAFAQENPERAIQLAAQQAITPASQPNPWRDYKVVGNNVVRAGPDGVESVYQAPQGPAKRPPPLRAADGHYYDQVTRERVFPDVVAKETNGTTISYDEEGRPIIQMGGTPRQELGRKESNEQQGKLATNIDLTGRLDRIGQLAGIDPETGLMSEEKARILTYRGQAEDWIATHAEKAGITPSEAARKAIAERTRFSTSVEQLFNAYRKEITGAAAAVQELERLKKSFLNVDMSPTQFAAAYDEYQRELKRSMRVSRMLLRQGFDLSSREGGGAMDRHFLGGADDNWETRGAELEAQGMSAEKIVEGLRREGYQP